MTSSIGKPKHFHRKFKFQIDIHGIGEASFATCSELKAEVAKIEYYEGGAIIPYKEPGRMSFPDLTIERAVTSHDKFYHWLVDTSAAVTQAGKISSQYKRPGTIYQFDRDNEIIRTWQLHGLWPLGYTAGAWDNNSDEFTMEQIVLALDYFVLGDNSKRGGETMGVFDAILDPWK